MNATFYSNFSKKINSTKRPTGGTVRSIRLKETCPLLNPVFILDGVNYDYNYVYWENRYYWVNDIIAVTNTVAEYHCTVDVLASWKNDIGSSTQYILRSASLYSNRIKDNMYPTNGAVYYDSKEAVLSNDLVIGNPSLGTYVIGIINKTGGVGAITYYAMSSVTFIAFMQYMLSSPVDNYDIDIDEITESLFKAVFNPAQYIVSATWIPLSISALNLPTPSTIEFGWWSAEGISASKLSDTKWYDTGSILVPKHPLELTRGEYLNQSPYASYYLYNTMYGTIPLDPTDLDDTNFLNFRIDVDLIGGESILEIMRGSTVIASKRATIGVPIQLAQLSFNGNSIVSTASNLVGAAASIDTGNVLGFIGSTFGAIGSIGALAKSETAGNNGTFIGIDRNLKLHAKFMGVVADDISHKGRPLCQDKQINTLSGYVLCSDGDIDTKATASEKDSIRSFLEGGFFYE